VRFSEKEEGEGEEVTWTSRAVYCEYEPTEGEKGNERKGEKGPKGGERASSPTIPCINRIARVEGGEKDHRGKGGKREEKGICKRILLPLMLIVKKKKIEL